MKEGFAKVDEQFERVDERLAQTATRRELREGVTELRAEMREGSAELRAEMKSLSTELRAEMKDGFAEMRSAHLTLVRTLLVSAVTIVVALLGILGTQVV